MLGWCGLYTWGKHTRPTLTTRSTLCTSSHYQGSKKNNFQKTYDSIDTTSLFIPSNSKGGSDHAPYSDWNTKYHYYKAEFFSSFLENGA
mmetsp:Transcript_17314/g.37953  ORF Transcript_17314/g.37953 Transcript_17314/m.37953 type:complete len:89 (-) Transcript_17314:87-353(-)